MTKTRLTRRRGEALEEAILGATWEELVARGYSGFSYDGVAKRAGTNRSVLTRRWQKRADLALASVSFYLRSNPVSVPDLGNIRDELIMYMHKTVDRGMAAMGILFGMRDYFAESNSSMADFRGNLAQYSTIDEVFRRAIWRGEIDQKKLTKRVAALPTDLLRHEALMTNRPIPNAVITDIVDTVFLPLVMKKKQLRS